MWFNANEKINIILTLVYKYILFKYLMHGSNQKQNKQKCDWLYRPINQPKKKKWNQPMWAYGRQRIKGMIKKRNQPMWAYRRQRIKGVIKKKNWLVGLCKRKQKTKKQKNEKNKKNAPCFNIWKVYIYIQDLILYLFVLLCCSIWKIIKLRMQTLIYWFETWNLFTGFIF